jgi:predicted nuclease with TOPRIM domain
MSNRVEELESQVAELQDAVDGLTEELVETRERLSELEADEGIDNTRTPDRREPSDPDPDPVDAEPEPESAAASDPDADAEAEDDSDSDGNDIIVA